MNYESWAKTVPEEITDDLLWKMEAYRLSLFTAEVGWRDVTKLSGDRRTGDLAGQLYWALGSIDANIAEGYSRGSGKDRARFYEYALGSARESRGWYYKGRHVLGEEVTRHRIAFLTHIIRLLLTMIPQQRATDAFHESSPSYRSADHEDLSCLLETMPLPE